MRLTWLLLSFALLGPTLSGCGDNSYRLGRAQGDGLGATAGSSSNIGSGGSSGDGPSGAGGAVASGGSKGIAGSGTSGGDNIGGTGGAAPPLTRDIVLLQSEPKVVCLVADEEHVYFNNPAGPVWRMDHSGSGLQMLAEGPAYCLAADTSHLYWRTTRAIQRIAKVGGSSQIVTQLETDLAPAGTRIAFDDSYVYASTPYAGGGAVARAPKSGGAMQVIGHPSNGAWGMAVAENTLFWEDRANVDVAIIQQTDLTTGETAMFHPAGSGQLLAVGPDLWFVSHSPFRFVRAPRDGGAPRHYRAPNNYPALQSDGTHFYWAYEQLIRINLATGVEELVADLPIPSFSAGLAITRDWVFVSPSNVLYRIAKPAP
jgi:hypothetical protein